MRECYICTGVDPQGPSSAQGSLIKQLEKDVQFVVERSLHSFLGTPGIGMARIYVGLGFNLALPDLFWDGKKSEWRRTTNHQ